MENNFVRRIEMLSKTSKFSAVLEESYDFFDKNQMGKLKKWTLQQLNGYSIPIDADEIDSEDGMEYRFNECVFKNFLGFNVSTFYNNVPSKIFIPSGIQKIEYSIENRINIELKLPIFGDIIKEDWAAFLSKIVYDYRDMPNTISRVKSKFLNILRNDFPENSNIPIVVYKREDIEILISNNRIEEAIEVIFSNKVNSSNKKIMYLSRLTHIKNEHSLGIIRHEDYILELNKIKNAIINEI